MLRFLGTFILLFSCIGTGMCMERTERRRISQLEELIRSMDYLKGEISFARTTIPEAMEQMSQRSNPPFDHLFSRLARELRRFPGKGFGEVLHLVLEQERGTWNLTSEDVNLFYQACSNLGYLDKEMQVHILERCMKDLGRTCDELSQQLPQKAKLYRSLGILGGIFLIILLL